ncbi:MAG: alcohol dehydrogenase catalytic domain-containing protein [Nitrospirae bacterium]|nr:alcohol dehydrogenase catalytic domain-containing protein [Nitrospirota bacterium]
MKVARLYSFNDIRIEEISIPEIGHNEALVRVRASGICSGDVMPWYIEKKAPLVLGHEPAGEIVEIGKGVREFTVGDRVFVHHHAPCMNCPFCMHGDYVQCSKWKEMGIEPGGIAEYIRIKENTLKRDTLKLPEEISYEDATLIEPVACVVKSFRRSRIKEGDTIAVLGLGVMGMIHILLARHYGAEKVIGIDRVPFRLNRARELGADLVIDFVKSNVVAEIKDNTERGGADVVIVGPNSVRAMTDGLRIVAPGGTVVFFTPAKPGEMLQIDPNELYFKDITITTSYSCGPDDTKEALGLIDKGLIRAEHLVTHRFRIEDTQKAYQLVADAGDSLKALIVFQ